MVRPFPSLEESRARLLEAIGEAPELTFVRGEGNRGDELIWAGTRELLEDHVYREIGLEELGSATGETALIAGGGAWCRPYHELMPRVLAVAELRFERVIVLPSSYDSDDDEVRAALNRTRAVVFAREPESLRRITGLCDARLAHDCAFFFPWQDAAPAAPGQGTLNAFRTDRERAGLLELPADNDDISATSPDLDAWLATISAHEHVRTDRAHVMIAAAMLGRSVEWAPSSTSKVASIAESALSGFPVRRMRLAPRVNGSRSNGARQAPIRDARVTALILSRDRPDLLGQSVRSVTASGAPVLVVDNNSGPAGRAAAAGLAEADPRVCVRFSDRNLGCAGGRRLGAELVDTEYTLFLDDDAELHPGALEALVADLDEHPEAGAVTALVLEPDGSVFHFGGWIEADESMVTFTIDGGHPSATDPSLAGTGPIGWVPGTAALIRTDLLRRYPIDPGMAAYYEDNEWCYRVALDRPDAFRRCREAVVTHHFEARDYATLFVRRSDVVERLAAYAHFLERHGRLMDVDLAALVPELRNDDGTPDREAMRLLLGLVAANGTDWLLAEWYGGGLAPLFERNAARARVTELASERDAATELAEAERTRAEEAAARTAEADARTRELAADVDLLNEELRKIQDGGWWRLRSRLLPVIRVASRLRR
jgi:GT2 family glycosyltransferase